MENLVPRKRLYKLELIVSRFERHAARNMTCKVGGCQTPFTSSNRRPSLAVDLFIGRWMPKHRGS
jgi:hypothetical protein